MMADLGKLLVVVGGVVMVAGVIFMLLGGAGLAPGRLPGDIVYHGKRTTLYFPLATSILLSLVLSLLLYAIGKMRR
jgi:hypothetical protein